MNDGSFRKVGHVSHVFQKFVFGRVAGLNLGFIIQLLLSVDFTENLNGILPIDDFSYEVRSLDGRNDIGGLNYVEDYEHLSSREYNLTVLKPPRI